MMDGLNSSLYRTQLALWSVVGQLMKINERQAITQQHNDTDFCRRRVAVVESTKLLYVGPG